MININPIPDPIIKTDYKNVYAPSDDSYMLIDYLRGCFNQDFFDGIAIERIENVLDLGTGTGIIAIFFQIIKSHHPRFNPMIYASDIEEEAIKCARDNEKLNNFKDEIKYFCSNLFESFPKSLHHSFNIITFNPPYLPASEFIHQDQNKKVIDHSWNGGRKGYEIFSRFLDEVKDFINPKGCLIYYISSSRVNLKELNKIIKQNGFTNILLQKKHIFFEDIILNKLLLV